MGEAQIEVHGNSGARGAAYSSRVLECIFLSLNAVAGLFRLSVCRRNRETQERFRCSRSLPYQVLDVSVVFLADVFDQFAFEHRRMSGEGPRLGKRLGIVDHVLDRQMSQVWAADALGHFHFIRMRDTGFVDPADIVLSNRLDHQRVTFPMPDGIAEPGLYDLRIVRAAIHEDLAPDVGSAFVNDPDLILVLHNAPRVRSGAHARNAGRQATGLRIVLAESCLALVVQGLGAGEQRNIDPGADHIDVFANRVGLPVAGKIGMAVGGARRGSGGRPIGGGLRGSGLASPAEL